jgi:hypothetical protein
MSASKVIRALAGSNTQTEYFPLTGGLNLEASTFRLTAGEALDAQNYEPFVNGGYRRIYGYERFSGLPKPSDAQYWIIDCTFAEGASFAIYDTVTGLTSGATGKWLKSESGSVVLTAVTGTFQSGEELQVAAVTQATSTSTASQVVGSQQLDAEYNNRAADYYRSQILEVPGSGAVRGVVWFDGVVYAFRNAPGGGSCNLYKSTASGWSQISFHHELAFTSGSSEYAEGETVTQGGVSATVKRVCLQSGTWGAGTAAGRLIITTPAGGNFAAGAISGGGTATASGAQTAITLLPNGKFTFDKYNFGAGRRVYGADGVNRAFEFDGDILAPIKTGMTTDTPTHIRAHKKHLFLSFGSSLQHSSLGLPFQWSAVTGALELSPGDVITGILPQGGDSTTGALAIFCRNSTHMLYGSSSSDWVLNVAVPDVGAAPYTVQQIGRARYLDDRGICDLLQTQTFGNFAASSLSVKVQSLVDRLRGHATTSSTLPSQNQYRVYFDDGQVLVMTFSGNKVLGVMPLLYSHVVRCIDVDEDANGGEVVFFGSDDGYVFQAEKGSSFDGGNIEAYIRLAFNTSKSFSLRKRYKKASIEITSGTYSVLRIQPDFSFGDPDIASHQVIDNVMLGAGAIWGIENWGTFVWGGTDHAPIHVKLDGVGNSMELLFYSTSDEYEPHILHGVVIHYIPGRIER